MKFLPPLADAINYPPLKVRALPTNKSITKNKSSVRKLPENVTCLGVFDQARTGLYVVAKTLISQIIWIPSYHCPALVEPFTYAGKSVKFYPVNANLTADLSFLKQQIKAGDTVIGVRYFGFDCQIAELAEFCRQHEVLLVEDLAHAAFFDKLCADVAVTSLVKFYPVAKGGELLLSCNSRLLKPLTDSLRELPSYNMVMCRKLLGKVASRFISPKSTAYRYFIKNNCSQNIQPIDMSIINSQDQSEISFTRQKNYRYLVENLKTCPWGEVLMPELPDKIVPYVVPFLLNNKKRFDHIRNKGIQIYRWEEMVETDCIISKKYRTNLVQLPCHQDLSKHELDYIVAVLMEENHDIT